MYRGDTPFSNDGCNDMDNQSGVPGIGYGRNEDEDIYRNFLLFLTMNDVDNKNEDFSNLFFRDDLFNNQNIQPSDNQKSSRILTELFAKVINQNIQPSDNQKSSRILTELFAILGPKMKSDTFIIESKRKWNLINIIKTYFIQSYTPNFINESIKEPDNKIRKINPDLLKTKFKTFPDIIDLRVKDIYFNDLCKKEIKGKIKIDNNKRIINNIEKDSDLDFKMNLKLRDVLKLFFNIETNLIGDFMKDGLQDYKQYFSSIKNNVKKKHKYKFLEKFIYSLNEIYLITKDNTKQSEKTTVAASKDL